MPCAISPRNLVLQFSFFCLEEYIRVINYSFNLSVTSLDSEVIARNNVNHLREGQQVQFEAMANILFAFDSHRVLN